MATREDAFGNELTDGDLVASEVRRLHDDLSESAQATGDYVANISRRIDSIDESLRSMLHHVEVEQAAHRRNVLVTLRQIKWALFALLVLLTLASHWI